MGVQLKAVYAREGFFEAPQVSKKDNKEFSMLPFARSVKKNICDTPRENGNDNSYGMG